MVELSPLAELLSSATVLCSEKSLRGRDLSGRHYHHEEVNDNAGCGQARAFPAHLRIFDTWHLPWCACLCDLFFTEIREPTTGEPATGRSGTCCRAQLCV